MQRAITIHHGSNHILVRLSPSLSLCRLSLLVTGTARTAAAPSAMAATTCRGSLGRTLSSSATSARENVSACIIAAMHTRQCTCCLSLYGDIALLEDHILTAVTVFVFYG